MNCGTLITVPKIVPQVILWVAVLLLPWYFYSRLQSTLDCFVYKPKKSYINCKKFEDFGIDYLVSGLWNPKNWLCIVKKSCLLNLKNNSNTPSLYHILPEEFSPLLRGSHHTYILTRCLLPLLCSFASKGGEFFAIFWLLRRYVLFVLDRKYRLAIFLSVESRHPNEPVCATFFLACMMSFAINRVWCKTKCLCIKWFLQQLDPESGQK